MESLFCVKPASRQGSEKIQLCRSSCVHLLAGYVNAQIAKSPEEIIDPRQALLQRVKDVWAQHASAGEIEQYFPGLSALLAPSSALQFALEHYAGLQSLKSSHLASELRTQFQSAAGLRHDPQRPKVDFGSHVPSELHIVERTARVVALLMRVLQNEVCHRAF